MPSLPLTKGLSPLLPNQGLIRDLPQLPRPPAHKTNYFDKKNLQLQIAHCHLFPPTTRVHYCKDCLRPLLASMPPLLHASCLDQPDLDPILITMLMQIMASS